MKIKRTLVIALIVLMMTIVPCNSFATAYEGVANVTPKYIYARVVNAELSINSDGLATCSGDVMTMSNTDSISIMLTLYKKNGTYWQKVTSYSKSLKGRMLELEKTKTVTHGTYKVVLTGTVTTANGDTERISDTSGQVTY